jgi:hypothetical protein
MSKLCDLLDSVYPIYICMETTGVHDSDAPTAAVVASDDCVEPYLYLYQVSDDLEEAAGRFLGKFYDGEKEDPIVTSRYVQSVLSWLEASGDSRQLALVCYSADFQKRFLLKVDPIFDSLPYIDVIQLAWCRQNATHSLLDVDDIGELVETMKQLTYGIRLGSYKNWFGSSGLILTEDPRSKVAAIMELWKRLKAGTRRSTRELV